MIYVAAFANNKTVMNRYCAVMIFSVQNNLCYILLDCSFWSTWGSSSSDFHKASFNLWKIPFLFPSPSWTTSLSDKKKTKWYDNRQRKQLFMIAQKYRCPNTAVRCSNKLPLLLCQFTSGRKSHSVTNLGTNGRHSIHDTMDPSYNHRFSSIYAITDILHETWKWVHPI